MSRSEALAYTLAGILAFLMAAGAAECSLITSLSEVTSPGGPGLTDYTYTLSVDPASSLPAVDLLLSVDPNANPTNVASPPGWTVSNTPGALEITSSEAAFDIGIGQSGQLSFSSSLPPVAIAYSVLGFDRVTEDFDFNSGVVAGPGTAAPEPSSLVLSGLGAVGLFLAVRRRRKA